MWPRLAALLLLTSASPLAESTPKTPFGGNILPADTKTWRCESGRTVVSFVPNTQFIWMFYRGEQHHLSPLASKMGLSGLMQYSDVAPGIEKSFGNGLLWVEDIRHHNKMKLFFVQIAKNNQRQSRLLETCRRTQP